MSACKTRRIPDDSTVTMIATGEIYQNMDNNQVVNREALARAIMREVYNNSQGVNDDIREIGNGTDLSNDVGLAVLGIDAAIDIAADLSGANLMGEADITMIMQDEAIKYMETVTSSSEAGGSVDGEVTAKNDAEQTSDSDIVPEEAIDEENDDDLLPKADLPAKDGIKRLSEIYSHYLVDNLRGHEEDMENLFMQVASRAWLSTDIESDTGMQFDEKVVRANIISQLNSMINGYYRRSATLMYSINKIKENYKLPYSTGDHGLLVFTDEKQLPASKEEFSKYTDSNGEEITFYTSKFLKNTDGKPLLLAVYKGTGDVSTLLMSAFMDQEGPFKDNTTIDWLSEVEGVANKFNAMNSETAQLLHEHPDSRNAYFAAIIRDNIDTFIDDLLPQLNSTFQTTIQTGTVDFDVYGSDLASRLLKLSIASTPLLYETSSKDDMNVKTTTFKLNANNPGSNVGEALQNAGLVAKVDAVGNRLIKFSRMDNDVYAIVLDIGGTTAVLVSRTDEMADGKVSWGYAVMDEGDLTSRSSDELMTDDSIDKSISTPIRRVLDVLNSKVASTKAIEEHLQSGLGGASRKSFFDVSTLIEESPLPAKGDTTTVLTANSLKSSFLYEAELEVASELLQQIPPTFDEAKLFLQKAMDDPAFRDVARAIYYRYFHEGEYKVQQINPLTGQLEIRTHRSMYDQGMRGSKAAEESTIALFNLLKSTAMANKMIMIDNSIVVTKLQQGTTVQSLYEDIDQGNTVAHEGRRVTNPEMFNRFKVELDSTVNGKQRYRIKFYQLGYNGKVVPNANISILIEDKGVTGKGAISGHKFTFIGEADNELTFDQFKTLASAARLPAMFRSAAFYQQFTEEAEMHMPTTETVYNRFGDLLVNVLAVKLANGSNIGSNTAYSESGANKLKLAAASEDHANVLYTMSDNAYDFRDALDSTLEKVFSNSKRKRVKNAEGADIAATIVSNKTKNLAQIIQQSEKALSEIRDIKDLEALPHINKYSMFYGPDSRLKLLGNGVTMSGIKNGTDGLSNQKLSRLDKAVFMIEGAYLDRAASAGSNFSEAGFQSGTMSDRSSIDANLVLIDEGIMPVLDKQPDFGVMAEGYTTAHTNAIKATSETIVATWKPYLTKLKADGVIGAKTDVDAINNISELYKLLNKLQLDFDEVSNNSGLTMNLAIVKAKDGKKSYATLNPATVQLYEIMTGTDAGNKRMRQIMLNSAYQLFVADIKSTGYAISNKAKSQLEEHLGVTLTTHDAENYLLKSFFLQDSMVEQELIAFLGGHIFQYGSKGNGMIGDIKSKRPNLMEDILGGKADEILDEIVNQKFQGKAIKDYTLKELKLAGEKGNTAGYIKSVADSTGLNSAEKVIILVMDDMFSLMSKQYIDRVKRNQGIGTSFQHYIQAEKGQPGILVPKQVREILFEDPARTVRILNSGEQEQEYQDALQQTSPIFYYQHNHSLGNHFSNFRAKGGMTKTVNVGNDPNGIYGYEKKAESPLFNYELTMHATPEHQRMFELMHDKIKFNQESDEFDGMYLDESLLAPSTTFDTVLSIDELRKHGESLGVVEVDGVQIEARTLLYQERLGEISLDTIGEIKTNKVKVKVNSALDLFRFWGGEELEAKAIREAENPDEFIAEYPYGFVWYKVTEAISNYRGTDNSFPLRGAYIAKSHTQQTKKTGQTYVNPSSFLSDSKVSYEDVKEHLVSTEHSGAILMLDIHTGDTTGSMSMNADEHDDLISVITQIISSATAQGQTVHLAKQLYNTIGAMGDIQLDLLNKELEAYNTEGVTAKEALKQYALDLTRSKLKSRKDPGTPGEILKLDDISMDIRQILPLARSAVNSNISDRIVRVKNKGGQYSLSALTDKVKYYKVDGYGDLMRNSVNGTGNDVNGVLSAIIADDPSKLPEDWKLEEVEDIQELSATHNKHDTVYIQNTITQGDGTQKVTYTPIKVGAILKGRPQTTDRIIFAHQQIGTSTLADSDAVNMVNFDEEFKEEIDALEQADDYEGIATLFSNAAANLEEGKILLTSNPIPMQYNPEIFDKVYSMPANTFRQRIAKFNLTPEGANAAINSKRDLDKVIFRNIPQEKVVVTDNFLSELFGVNGKLMSPWVNNEGSENRKQAQAGHDLKYLDAHKDGKSIYEHDHYYSYFLAGKAPKDFASMKKVPTKKALKQYFLAETGSTSPPAVLWAKFFYRDHKVLGATPIYGDAMLKDAMEGWDKAKAPTIKAFYEFIVEQNDDPQRFTTQMKAQLFNELQQPGWAGKEAEMYMTPHHQAAFLMYNGDLKEDFVGTQEQPDITTIGHLVPDVDERDMIQMHWSEPATQELVNSKLAGTEEGDRYIALRKMQNAKLESKFTERVNEVHNIAKKGIRKLSRQQKKGMLKRAPLFLLEGVKSNSKALNETIDKLLQSPEISGNNYLLETLTSLKSMITPGITKAQLNKLVDDVIVDFKKHWVATLTENFDTSLTFLTARIPAHGKPSAAPAKIKNFIYSTRNTIYGPVEMLTVAGSDFDGDKQNNMTWDVDNLGAIIDWRPMLNEYGVVDLAEYERQVDIQLKDLGTKLKESGMEDDAIQDNLAKFRKARMEYAFRASQNYITHLLINTSKDAKNMLEATTITSMNKLKVVKDYLASFDFSDIDNSKYKIASDGSLSDEMVEAIAARQHAIPFIPSTKFLYERINGDGKKGVGIFASAIKAYYASYFAWITNGTVTDFEEKLQARLDANPNMKLEEMTQEELAKLFDELTGREQKDVKHLAFNNKYASQSAYKALNLEKDALHFIWTDPKTGLLKIRTDITMLANTREFSMRKFANGIGGVLHTRVAKSVYSALRAIQESGGTAEEEAALVERHIASLHIYNDAALEDPAWDDLAQLLNAATDNAKELILSKISANSDTSAMISTMVILGIDLRAALTVVNHPIIKKAMEDASKSKKMTGEISEFKLSFKRALEQAAENYSSDEKKVLTDKTIAYNVDAAIANGTLPAESRDTEIEHQKMLRKFFNPAEQIGWYLEMGAELTKLSQTLAINGGIPNSELDILNYNLAVTDALNLNDKINDRAYNISNFTGKTDETIPSAETLSARSDIIDYADKKKIILNIPFVLAQNGHFFSYIKGMVKTNEILRDVSFTVESIYNDLVTMLPEGKQKLENFELNSYISLVMTLAIDQYFENSNKVYTFEDVTYDMSNREDRKAFLQNFPDIFKNVVSTDEELSDNRVLNIISNIRTETDIATGVSFSMLSGVDTSTLPTGKVQSYKNKIANLKKDGRHSVLHDALLSYSLLLDKGGLGKNSLAALFDGVDYKDVSKFLSDMQKSGEMLTIVKNIPEDVKRLLVPFLLEEYSTKEVKSNGEQAYGEDGDTYSDMHEDPYDTAFTDEDYDNLDAGFNNKYEKAARDKAAKYDVSEMNRRHANGTVPAVWKSKTNGLTYAWHGKSNSYIPITRTVPERMMDIKPDVTSSVLHDLKELGWDWGFEVIIPGTTEKGRVLSLHNEVALTYNVLKEDGTIVTISGKLLKNTNPSISLQYEAIGIRPLRYTVTDALTFYKNKDGSLSTVKTANSTEVTLTVSPEEVIHEHNQMPVTELLTNKIKSSFEAKNDSDINQDLTMTKMTAAVQPMMEELAYMIMSKNDKKANTKALNSKDSNKEYNNAYREVYAAISVLSETDVYALIRRKPAARLKLLKELTATKGLFEDVHEYKITVRDDATLAAINNAKQPIFASDITLMTAQGKLQNMQINSFLRAAKGLNLGVDVQTLLNLTHKKVYVSGEKVVVSPTVHITDKAVKAQKAELLIPNNEKGKVLRDVSPDVIRSLGTFLNNRFKNSNVTVLSTADIKQRFGEKFSKAAGFVYNGEIYLNSDIATLQTALHEFGHLYLAELKETDPALYTHLMQLASEDPMMEKMKSLYPELDTQDLAEEVFVELLARRDSDKLETAMTAELSGEDGSFLGKVKSFFKNMFKDFLGVTVKDANSINLNDSLYETLDKIGLDLIFNKNSMLKSMPTYKKKAIKTRIGTDAKMSKAEAVKFLTERGYIKKVC